MILIIVLALGFNLFYADRSWADSKLQVSASPIKDNFSLSERVRFHVRGNQRFYLYLFAIDENQDQATMILPNAIQKANQYEANITHLTPNPNISYYATTAGEQNYLLLASSHYIPWQLNQFTQKDHFYVGGLSLVNKQIQRQLERNGASTRSGSVISIYSSQFTANVKADNQNKEQISVNNQSAVVTAQANNPPQSKPKPNPTSTPQTKTDEFAELGQNKTVFIKSDKMLYRVKDKIKLSFGADRDGWICVFIVSENGMISPLTELNVEAKTVHNLVLQAQNPKGKFQLIVAHHPEKLDNFDFLKSLDIKSRPIKSADYPSIQLDYYSYLID